MARLIIEEASAAEAGFKQLSQEAARRIVAQLVQLQQEVLDGVGTTETVELIASTAQGILDSADCAIGHEAARMVLKSLRSFEGDYHSHAERDLCSAERNAYVPCQGTPCV